MSNKYETQSNTTKYLHLANSTNKPTHLQGEADQGRGFAAAVIPCMRFLLRRLLPFHLNVAFSKRLSPWLCPGVGLEPGLAFGLPCTWSGLILLPCIPLQFISRNEPWQALEKRTKKKRTNKDPCESKHFNLLSPISQTYRLDSRCVYWGPVSSALVGIEQEQHR